MPDSPSIPRDTQDRCRASRGSHCDRSCASHRYVARECGHFAPTSAQLSKGHWHALRRADRSRAFVPSPLRSSPCPRSAVSSFSSPSSCLQSSRVRRARRRPSSSARSSPAAATRVRATRTTSSSSSTAAARRSMSPAGRSSMRRHRRRTGRRPRSPDRSLRAGTTSSSLPPLRPSARRSRRPTRRERRTLRARAARSRSHGQRCAHLRRDCRKLCERRVRR